MESSWIRHDSADHLLMMRLAHTAACRAEGHKGISGTRRRYACRKALAGSVRDARIAGTALARRATAASTVPAIAIVAGDRGRTPNSRLLTRVDAQRLATTPAISPTTVK